MTTFSLEVFDKHIQNLQSQLSFLAEALESTDHNDPEWISTDLISLKGKTGMLCDDMRRVRKRLASEWVRVGKQTSNKRLSIEGANKSTSNSTNGSKAGERNDAGQISPPVQDTQPNLDPKAEQTEEYQVQYVDVTEEVNRRLRESRLRQLRDSPSTSQKRKRDGVEVVRRGEVTAEEEAGNAEDMFASLRSPTKKLKAFGQFEQVLKPKEGVKRGDENGDARERPEGREEVKRRRLGG